MALTRAEHEKDDLPTIDTILVQTRKVVSTNIYDVYPPGVGVHSPVFHGQYIDNYSTPVLFLGCELVLYIQSGQLYTAVVMWQSL